MPALQADSFPLPRTGRAAGAFAGLAVLLALRGALLQVQKPCLLLGGQPLAVLVGLAMGEGKVFSRRKMDCGAQIGVRSHFPVIFPRNFSGKN